MSAISPKKSPKREVVDLTDESDADTKSPTKVLGKRPAQSEPELQSPTKEAKSAPSPPTTTVDDSEDKAVDCAGCVVIMGINEEPDMNVWLKVPEDQFHADLRPLAKRYKFQGQSMVQYLRQARCIPDKKDDGWDLEDDDEDDEEGDDDDEDAKDGRESKVSEGTALSNLLDAWCAQDYVMRGACAPQLKNIKHFVSVWIYE